MLMDALLQFVAKGALELPQRQAGQLRKLAAAERLMARNRHAAAVAKCPVLRDERTCRQRCLRTAFDPLADLATVRGADGNPGQMSTRCVGMATSKALMRRCASSWRSPELGENLRRPQPLRNCKSNLLNSSGCSCCTQCPAPSTKYVPRHWVQTPLCIRSRTPGFW
jgi:hypothetical protein